MFKKYCGVNKYFNFISKQKYVVKKKHQKVINTKVIAFAKVFKLFK